MRLEVDKLIYRIKNKHTLNKKTEKVFPVFFANQNFYSFFHLQVDLSRARKSSWSENPALADILNLQDST